MPDQRDGLDRVRMRRWLGTGLRLVIPLAAAAFAVLPVLWIVSAALSPSNTLVNQSIIPPGASLANFQRLLEDPRYPFLGWMLNSLKVSTITCLIVVGFTAGAAFAFARLRFRGRAVGLRSLLVLQLFPNTLAIVALYLLLLELGRVAPVLGLGSHWGLILIYCGGALSFNVWLVKGYLDSIPMALDESARIDGATDLQVFWHVVLPLAKPILLVVTLVVFIATYGDFLLPRVMLQRVDDYTLAVGLSLLIRDNYTNQWGAFAAGSLIGAVPVLLLFFLLQRELVGGLTRGAIKG